MTSQNDDIPWANHIHGVQPPGQQPPPPTMGNLATSNANFIIMRRKITKANIIIKDWTQYQQFLVIMVNDIFFGDLKITNCQYLVILYYHLVI